MRSEELGIKKKETRNFRLIFGFFLAISCGIFSSCEKNNGQLQLQTLAPEDLSPRIEWALVALPYVACKEEPSYEAQTVQAFRKGELYEITGNRTIVVDGEKELWYAVESGWIPSNTVQVYSNKLKAERARNQLK